MADTKGPVGTKMSDGVWSNVQCGKCNSVTGMLVGNNNCPGCGLPIRAR